jgi:hypothetical protein
MLLRNLARILRERPREVVPRGTSPLSWRAMLDCRHTGGFEGGYLRKRQAGKAKDGASQA